MTTRADKFTIEVNKKEYFSDFLTNFDKNPVTGQLARVTNEESVKQQMSNLIKTMYGERFYDDTIGSKVASSLFELDTIITEIELNSSIREVINNNMPMVELKDVGSNFFEETNTFAISISFVILNNPERVVDLEFILSKVR